MGRLPQAILFDSNSCLSACHLLDLGAIVQAWL
jgi:hypothetical protein